MVNIWSQNSDRVTVKQTAIKKRHVPLRCDVIGSLAIMQGHASDSKCSRSAEIISLETYRKELRPAGGVKHRDSDLVETGMLSAKKALRWIEGSILINSRKF